MVFRKIKTSCGMKTLWIFFGGHHKIGLYLGVIFKHFIVFSEGQGTKWGIFFGLLKFQIFFGAFEIPDILGRMVDAGPEPPYEEKLRVPPPPPGVGAH